MMSRKLSTVEMEEDIQRWLEWYAHEHELNFSDALNNVVSIGRQVIEKEAPFPVLPIHLKLIIQCVMESLLILRETHLRDPEKNKIVSELAKTVIRQTLDMPGIEECHPY